MKEQQKAYKEILKLLNKHKDILNFDVPHLERQAAYHLLGLELKQVYGLNIDPKDINNLEWNRFGNFSDIGKWGSKYGRTISWSDDGEQPVDETLLRISFPTGAYLFGDDYPTEIFQQFFNEIKSYNPNYSDTTNKSLYWSLDSAAPVFNSFNDIYKKYRELNAEDIKLHRIKKMKEELEKLESNA